MTFRTSEGAVGHAARGMKFTRTCLIKILGILKRVILRIVRIMRDMRKGLTSDMSACASCTHEAMT